MCMPSCEAHPGNSLLWGLGLCDGCCSFLYLLFLGCELTASTKSYTFQVDDEDDSEHILALSVVREMRMNYACSLP